MTLPRNMQIWLPGYVKNRLRVLGQEPARRVWLAFTDHFEPLWQHVTEDVGAERVGQWAREWPRIAARFQDAGGRPPRYTFFYPEEEYRPHLMVPIERLVASGIADVEVHIHHGQEGEQQFLDRMYGFLEILRRDHGMLRKWKGKTAFGFIHGNWALDNARPDGQFCGLNNEISLLRDLGCYADFTMPSGTEPTQARLLNTIYWATDDPDKPKSYDTGIPVRPDCAAVGDLLMIPGPLGLRWKERLMPRLECGELACYDPPTPYRVRRWLDLAPKIGADLFLKLHTHGTQERHSKFLLHGGIESTIELLQKECQRTGSDLFFASAWEMRQVIEALQTSAPLPVVSADLPQVR